MSSKIFLLLLAVYSANSARILGIFPTPSHSHFVLGFRLMEELANRGHQVTVVNPFPQKIPIKNYVDVSVENIKDVLIESRKDFYNRDKRSTFNNIKFINNMSYRLTEKLLVHENFQKLLKSQEQFDLIILEYFLNEAIMGVGHIFNAPIILLSTLPSSAFVNHLSANPAPSSYVPHIFSPFTSEMDFWQRLSNLAYNTFGTIYKQFYMLPLHDQLLKAYISEDLDIERVTSNASLIFLNSHPSFTEAVPHTANMIEIGGFHIPPPKNLSAEFQEYMDDAKDGVVLFSMGSNLKSSDLDQDKRQGILKAFGKIKQKVIWKFEEDILDQDLPKNVKLVNWLPQQDILAHPNTKAFITHGGLLSAIEAVHNGVPLIGIPIYGDQKMNVAKAVQNGYAVSVPYQQLSEQTLSAALQKVIKDSKYADNAKMRSKIMKDQPVRSLDSAMFWIEFVIRHKGATHLQSPGIHLKWYKRNLIDIILVLVVIDVLLFLIFYYIIKHIIHLVGRKMERGSNKKYLRFDKEK